MDIFDFLEQNHISYQRFDHMAVFTCEQAKKSLPKIPAAETKNLFLRDKKGLRHLLVCVPAEKRVDLVTLAKEIGTDRLSMGSPDRLKAHLGVDPGSVTILGLIHDSTHKVELIIDQAIWDADAVQCHPLVNTSTLALSQGEHRRFLELTGHQPKVMSVPAAS